MNWKNEIMVALKKSAGDYEEFAGVAEGEYKVTGEESSKVGTRYWVERTKDVQKVIGLLEEGWPVVYRALEDYQETLEFRKGAGQDKEDLPAEMRVLQKLINNW